MTENDREDTQKNYPITRRTILATLGISGLGLYSDTTQASEADTSRNPIYNWQKDVDANSHELSDLRALSMAAGSSSVVDFAGDNLSIDDSGVLNASTAGGIATSGKRILLDSSMVHDFYVGFRDNKAEYRLHERSAHPFPIGQIKYSSIEQLYVSITAIAREEQETPPSYIRAYDFTSEAPIKGTEVKIEDACDSPTLVEGPVAEYNADKTVILGIQDKRTGPDNPRTISKITLNIWGEIA